MVSCYVVLTGLASTRSVVCCLLTGSGQNPLAPTPVVGRVGRRSAHHTRHLRAEEVARPWTGRPGNRAIKDLAVRRPRYQARKIKPADRAHPGDPVGAT
jgi:hypothetical protein